MIFMVFQWTFRWLALHSVTFELPFGSERYSQKAAICGAEDVVAGLQSRHQARHRGTRALGIHLTLALEGFKGPAAMVDTHLRRS